MRRLILIGSLILLGFTFLEGKMRIYTHVDSADFPRELRMNLAFHPWEKGFLDVSKPPFSADSDGKTDATSALQLAIDHAYACNLVVFIPQGTYLVSEQLSCYQDPGPQLPNNPISSLGQRKFGHIIKGSSKNGKWPVIRLKDGSIVKDNTLFVFKYFDRESGEEDASRHYLGSLRNLEIDMGDNPDISAVYNNGAQLCVLQNLKIYGSFHKGISTLPGSGGYTANIEITGGRIGIYQNNFRPNPTLFNIVLDGQSECGLKVLDTRGSLTMAGFSIKSPDNPGSSYRAVSLYNEATPIELGARANLNLVDGSIEMLGSAPAITTFSQDLVMRNVFFNAETIVESGSWSGNPKVLKGKPGGWRLLPEYVYASVMDGASVYLNGTNMRGSQADFIMHDELLDSIPPASLLSMHHWGEIPSWEDSMLVDLVVDYGATRDADWDDDAPLIQEALNDISTPGHEHYGKVLFIPRGHFHLKSQVIVPAGCRVIGASKSISVLVISENWFSSAPVSALSTENTKGPGVVLSDFAIVALHPHPDVAGGSHAHISALNHQCAESIIRDLQTDWRKVKWQGHRYGEPTLQFSGNAGGKVFGLCFDEGTLGIAAKQYRHVKISETQNPLTFYQISVEDASVEEDEEQTLHMEIDSCADIRIYGFKYEKESELLHVSNTGSLTIIGGSGNYGLKDPDDEAIISISDTPEVFIANISRRIQDGEIPGKAFLRDEDLVLPGDAPIAYYKKEFMGPEAESDTFRLDFMVIPGAEIIIAGDTLVCNEEGTSGTYLEAGKCIYEVRADGFLVVIDSLQLSRDTLIVVELIRNALGGTEQVQSFMLHPNPAGELLFVQFMAPGDALEQLEIFDVRGGLQKSIPLQVSSGKNNTALPVADLDPGPYVLRLMDYRRVFIKQRR